MRDLRKAAREGVRPFLLSLVHFPRRHPFLIAGLALATAISLLALGYVETGHKVTRVERNVIEIQTASPCITRPKSEACKRSFEQAVLTITHAEACAILRKAGLEVVSCAGARLRQERGRREDRERSAGSSPPHGTHLDGETHNQKPGITDEPSHPHAPSVTDQFPHHHGTSKGAKQPPQPSSPDAQADPGPVSGGSAEASGPPAPAPAAGDSGETPAGEHSQGVEACVGLVVSACIEAPGLLP